ncbi:MAG TPA: peroxiredoxin [Polyangiaceae bacterium]|nr:peroxiredoxin [Polyangiaceae bacterium]
MRSRSPAPISSLMLTRRALIVGAALGLAPVACMAKRPDGGSGLLALGAAAPDFAAKDASGKVVHLSDFNGSPRVVYFYPKDETPGCTKEACAFRDTYEKFKAKGVVVFGVSRDTEKSHDEFRAAHELPFPLAADPDGAVQKAYGVPSMMPNVASRVSFLVGRDGKVEHVFEKVDPVVHADEVLDMVK